MKLQRTLKSQVTIEGIGLHSGKPATLRIHPAQPGHGISFSRVDLPSSPTIPADFHNVVSTRMATTLGLKGVTIATVEHLMCALALLEIDNALVEVDGPEVPIMDGSSLPFCEAILRVGIQEQRAVRAALRLRRRVELKMGEKWAVAEPCSRLEIHASIDWDHPVIGYQEFQYRSDRTAPKELWAARTFGFVHEVEALKRMGLARGGSLDNAVVLDHAQVLNPDGLRYPDEFVRHKVLDAIGDLKLGGIEIQAYIRLHRSGHDLHSQLLAEIFKDPSSFEVIDDTVGDEYENQEIAFGRAALAAI